jgi:hypothetical protein
MSRKVRVSFAAPLVMIAVGPACVIHTAKAPPPTVEGNGTGSAQPGPIMNPPRPVDPSTTPDHAAGPDTPGTAQQGPTQPANLGSWTVTMSQGDHTCYAQVAVTCPPKGATCNPPPPRAMEACPSGMSMDRPVRIVEETADQCAVYFPMPACPSGASCNPPRPQKIDCPQ